MSDARRLALLLLVLAACASDRVVLADGTRAHVRRDHCCTERDDAPMNVAESCAATAGCSYGPALVCRGVDVPDDIAAEERAAREACRMACACTCPEDLERCANTP